MNRVIDEIVSLLSTAMTTKFTTYYKGEVFPVPQSNLPAVMIYPVRTKVVAKSTTKDQYEYTIGIRAVVNVKAYFDEAGTGTTIDAHRAIVNLMEERNSDGTLIASCVLGVLRDNVRGTDFLYNNDIGIEYKRIEGKEFPYLEANLTVSKITDLLTR